MLQPIDIFENKYQPGSVKISDSVYADSAHVFSSSITTYSAMDTGYTGQWTEIWRDPLPDLDLSVGSHF